MIAENGAKTKGNIKQGLISLASALVNLFVALLLVASLLFLLALIINAVNPNIESLQKSVNATSNILTDSSDIMVAFFKIAVVLFIFFFVWVLISWIFKEGPMVILPFEVPTGETKYSGKAISDQLVVQLHRICQIYTIKQEGIRPIESEQPTLPVLFVASKNEPYRITESTSLGPILLDVKRDEVINSIANLGNLGLGSTSISIGQLLIFLKQLCPGSKPGRIITGSLQRYGSMICLTACLEHQGLCAWEACSRFSCRKHKQDECLPTLIKDLSYKIVYDISKNEGSNGVSAKTWSSFKYFTEALDSYYQYSLTEDEQMLECTRVNSLKAANSELCYERTFGLLLNLGLIYFDKRNYFTSKEIFHKAVSVKLDAGAFVGLGHSYKYLDCKNEAEEAYQKATKLCPKCERDWYNKGIAHGELGEYRKAVESFDEAILLNPRYLEAYNNKGVALSEWAKQLRERDKHVDAIDAYKKAIKIDPNKYTVWHNLGNSYVALEQYKEAIGAFKKAIEVKPNEYEAWHNLGNVYVAQQRYDDAIDAYSKAIKLEPKNVASWNNLGYLYAAQQSYDDAIDAYLKATKIDDKHAETWYNLGYAYAAQQTQQSYDNAIDAYLKATKIDDKHAETWYNLGCAYAAQRTQQSYDKAINAYLKAIEINPDDADFFYNLGLAYTEKGLNDEAEKVFQKAEEIKSKTQANPNMT